MSRQLVNIADRYDVELDKASQDVLKRIAAAYDVSYRAMVAKLRDAMPRLQQAGSISTLVRQGAIAAELGEALKFLNPGNEQAIEQLGYDVIQQAVDLGQQMAGDSLNYIGLQAPFTTIPIGAVRNQAERFRERLVNYSNQQASQISAVVEQGLIQGWGTRKIEGQLKTLGVSFKSNAETIARTETMSAYNGAARSRYEQAGVAYVQWIATPAEGTCSLCYARNTKAWKTTEAPAIPAHPRCRCTYLPTASLSDIDTAFYEDYSKQGLDDLERQGLQPDNGPTYWEKKAGVTPAKPSWVPGQAVPVAPVAANPAPVVKSGFPAKDDLDSLEFVKQLGGSTGAELVRDPASGDLFVRKRGSQPDHIREEFAADEAYQALGVKVPEARLFETQNGPVKLARFIEGKQLNELDPATRKAAIKKLQANFAADALLANWDVLGMTRDNILVDADGTPWRIDNGGSLRYRAQGGLKSGQEWNDYPTELWSLRDPARGAGEIFSGIKYSTVIKQIEALAKKESKLLKVLPKDLHDTIQGRIREMKRVVEITRTLQSDDWRDGYIDEFCRHSVGIRNAGITDRLPMQMRLANNQLYDENDKLFDNLRGKGSILENLVDYIGAQGGDYNAVIPLWADQQASSSWGPLPQAVKWHYVQARGVGLDQYWWRNGSDQAKAHYDNFRDSVGGNVFDVTLAAFHAWNYEQLQRIEMPNNNRSDGTFQLVRTESLRTMQRNSLNEGDVDVTMPRGAAESTSLFSRVEAVAGQETTVQQVPHHRIVGMYLQSRDAFSEGRMFLGDYENEAVAIMQGIKFNYVPLQKWQDAQQNYKQSSKPMPAAPMTVKQIKQDWLKKIDASDIQKMQKTWSIKELAETADQLGISQNKLKLFGSLKAKLTYIQAFLDLQVDLNEP